MKIQKKIRRISEKRQKIGHKIKNENIISIIPFILSTNKNSSSEEEKSNIINLKDEDSTEKIIFINIKSINQKNIMTINNEKINLIY